MNEPIAKHIMFQNMSEITGHFKYLDEYDDDSYTNATINEKIEKINEILKKYKNCEKEKDDLKKNIMYEINNIINESFEKISSGTTLNIVEKYIDDKLNNLLAITNKKLKDNCNLINIFDINVSASASANDFMNRLTPTKIAIEKSKKNVSFFANFFNKESIKIENFLKEFNKYKENIKESFKIKNSRRKL